eukprot:5508349-Amphidinium_carterae.1
MKSAISSLDTEVFGYSTGDSAGQQTWECLARLVLTRHWREVLANPAIRWVVRNDNMILHRPALGQDFHSSWLRSGARR